MTIYIVFTAFTSDYYSFCVFPYSVCVPTQYMNIISIFFTVLSTTEGGFVKLLGDSPAFSYEHLCNLILPVIGEVRSSDMHHVPEQTNKRLQQPHVLWLLFPERETIEICRQKVTFFWSHQIDFSSR